MEKSQEIGELITALSRAQGEFPAVPLNAVNPFLKNHYADLGSVIETVKSILSNHQLSVTQLAKSEGAFIGVTTVLAHASGQWISDTITLPLSDEKGKSLAQVAGSVITYLRRYAYVSILGLYAGDDDDGNDPKSTDRKPEQRKPQAPIPQKPVAPKTGENPASDNGHKDPEKITDDATLITVWNGTQKPAQELLSEKAVEAFMKAFVTDKNTNPGEHLFNSKAYLTNHLRSHFKVDALKEMTYEKVMACLNYMNTKVGDPRWYPVEPPKDTPAATTVTPTAEPDPVPDAGNPQFDVLAEKWQGKKYVELSDRQQEKIRLVIKLGSITEPKMTDDGLLEYLKTDE